MARTEKKTQIKGYPSKVLLNLRDNMLNYFYPTSKALNNVVTGNIKFDDTETLAFGSSSNLIYGLGLPATNIHVQNELKFMTSSLSGSGGVIRTGVGPSLILYSASLPTYTPFVDSQQYAADAKSSNALLFASGATLQGFGSPLWSKYKIEVNLSTTVSQTLGDKWGPVYSESYNMAYYNHVSATWQPVGSPRVATYYISQALATPTVGVMPWFTEKAIGFGAHSVFRNIAGTNQEVLQQVRAFREHGFPFAGKYFVPPTGPSSSILYPLSNIINRPFLLEAVVVDFTGSFNSGDLLCSWGGGALGSATSFFFILNQRNGATINERVVPPLVFGSYNTTESYFVGHNSGSMDIVTSLPIFTPGTESWFPLYPVSRENDVLPVLQQNPNLNIIFPTANGDVLQISQSLLKWSGRYRISGVVSSPTPFDVGDTSEKLTIRSGSTTQTYLTYPTFPNTRNGLSSIYGDRNFLNSAAGYQKQAVWRIDAGSYETINAVGWIKNPYILYPSDQLIFGWQSPHAGEIYERQTVDGIFTTGSGILGPQLTIAPGFSKVVLYGSYLQNGKEYEQTLNQVVSSNAINEAIE